MIVASSHLRYGLGPAIIVLHSVWLCAGSCCGEGSHSTYQSATPLQECPLEVCCGRVSSQEVSRCSLERKKRFVAKEAFS